jgi:hypothetical protein
MFCVKPRLYKDSTLVTFDTFNAEINYTRGIRVRIDTASRQCGRSDGKKLTNEEAQVMRQEF